MKINVLRAILIMLLIGIFCIIFNFSNQDGEKSADLSREVTEMVTKDVKSIQKLEKNQQEEILEKIEYMIRKMAHFCLYTLVGVFSMSLMSTYSLKQIIRITSSLGIGALYAISDEFHQSFTPGRTALFGDVCIDSCGVMVGIGIVIIVIRINKRLLEFKNENRKDLTK